MTITIHKRVGKTGYRVASPGMTDKVYPSWPAVARAYGLSATPRPTFPVVVTVHA